MLPTISCSSAVLGLPGPRPRLLAGAIPAAPRLAIVGSRAALHRVLAVVPALVRVAAAHGLALVSGGARGVDRSVHDAALAQAVPQLAVLPCSPDALYPPEHADLFTAIARTPGSGLLFSLSPGTTPARGVFASRNATILDLVGAVVIAQSAPRSGSWSTGRQALRRGLRTAALTGSPGNAELIAAGAAAIDIADGGVPDTFSTWLSGQAPAPRPWPDELAWLRAAFTAAGAAGLTLDELDDPRACTALLTAELRGLVVESSPGRYHAA
ncbi:MAG: DNA-processing protein DprA [Myxococcales bacterium]|nr:DNA-processing protein DprA [Myxococcales bacterium]